jgi:hypothetical protein
MTTNRLKAAGSSAYTPKLKAAEYAAIARENGDWDKAKPWQRVADERGEKRVPDGYTVRFKDKETTHWVRIAK